MNNHPFPFHRTALPFRFLLLTTYYLLPAVLFLLLTIPFSYGWEVPLEFHGGGGISKYLNSHSARFNMDVLADLYCVIIRNRGFSYYINYRDELDMGLQSGGVTFDPRNVHYSIITGFDHRWSKWFGRFYFVHDCYHDVDRLVDGTPVFNRFRLQAGLRDLHYAQAAEPLSRFAGAITLGLYPHIPYHGWDINAGADFNYDLILEGRAALYRSTRFTVDFQPRFHYTRGDSISYHEHLLRLLGYYHARGRRIGISLDYNLYNNDPIKSPDHLWLYSIFIEF